MASPRNVVSNVVASVNVSYQETVTAEELAALIVDPASAEQADGRVLTFFGEVSLDRQLAFIDAMNVDRSQARKVAAEFSRRFAHVMPLAEAP